MRRTLTTLVLLLSACTVTQEELDAVKEERAALKGKLEQVRDELDVAKGKVKELQVKLEKAKTAKPSRPPAAVVAAAKSQLQLEDGAKLTATFKTNMGEIACALWPEVAPQTVLNFVGLAEGTKEYTDPRDKLVKKEPFYNGTTFHRVSKDFMIQGGDPTGTGMGGPGYTFADEVWPDVRFDRPGLLAMANAGKGTNGSQFFITDSTPAYLNGKHTIFGECELATVKKIMGVEVEPQPSGAEVSRPKKPVTIESIAIKRG